MKKIAVLTLALLVALPVARCGLCQEKSPPTTTTTQIPQDVIPKGWLKEKTTIEKAEQNHLVTDRRLGPKPVPFGFINARWEKFKAGIKIGDELWEFESPGKSWEKLAGRAGFCIVRAGRIIDAIITRMN
jgi:hypothetical protein